MYTGRIFNGRRCFTLAALSLLEYSNFPLFGLVYNVTCIFSALFALRLLIAKCSRGTKAQAATKLSSTISFKGDRVHIEKKQFSK